MQHVLVGSDMVTSPGGEVTKHAALTEHTVRQVYGCVDGGIAHRQCEAVGHVAASDVSQHVEVVSVAHEVIVKADTCKKMKSGLVSFKVSKRQCDTCFKKRVATEAEATAPTHRWLIPPPPFVHRLLAGIRIRVHQAAQRRVA